MSNGKNRLQEILENTGTAPGPLGVGNDLTQAEWRKLGDADLAAHGAIRCEVCGGHGVDDHGRICLACNGWGAIRSKYRRS